MPAIVLALRREVNLGCPVAGCGSPFLTWHHFDPPWKLEHHHRPDEFRAGVGERCPGLGRRADDVVDLARAHGSDSDGKVPVISIAGKLRAHGVQLYLTSTRMRLVLNGVPERISFSPLLPPGSACNFVRTDIKTGRQTPLMGFG
jgi:hypothetical protein